MARKTKEAAQETRNCILDAAEQVFQRQGVSRTWGRSSSRVTSRHFDHGNGTLAFTSKLFRFG